MPKLPSVKTLERITHDRDGAKALRKILEVETPWVAMRRADDLIVRGGNGVEYIPEGHNAKSPAIHYCNTGDTYASTLLYVRGRYSVGCWGDIVERGDYD